MVPGRPHECVQLSAGSLLHHYPACVVQAQGPPVMVPVLSALWEPALALAAVGHELWAAARAPLVLEQREQRVSPLLVHARADASAAAAARALAD